MFPLHFQPQIARDIRKATVADATACACIHGMNFIRGWSEPEFEALLADSQVIGHLAVRFENDFVEGFALSRLAADQAEILSIAILPELHGKRLGRGLLRRHMEALAMLGVRKLFLEVNEDNASALALYRACGFREVGRRKGYYAMGSGKPADALILCHDA